MSFAKWIGASLGWSFGGPIGAIIGLAIGSIADVFTKGDFGKFLGEGDTTRTGRQRSPYNRPRQETPRTKSGDFEVSLLILASVV
ncbi:MAG TPA: hypothetical protein VKZ98_08860, partial [Aquaticitalea sp.]|nr:hypothetical protein [Aquaticitalea sp.]